MSIEYKYSGMVVFMLIQNIVFLAENPEAQWRKLTHDIT